MKKLTTKELANINGGASATAVLALGLTVTAIFTFIIGVIEGITNPTTCKGDD